MCFGDLEDPGLRLVDQVVYGALSGFVDILDRAGRGVDEPPQQCLVPDDARMVLDIGRRRDGVDEFREVLDPSSALEFAPCAQVVSDRDGVDRRPLLLELAHGPVEDPVRLAEEHRGIDDLLDADHRLRIEEDAGEDRDLGLERVGRLTVVAGRNRGPGHRLQRRHVDLLQ